MYNQFLEWFGADDDALREIVVEASGLADEDNAAAWRPLVDVTMAREWLEAVNVATNYFSGYCITRTLCRAAGRRWVAYAKTTFTHTHTRQQKLADPVYAELNRRREQLIRLRDMKWQRYSDQLDLCWELSQALFTGTPESLNVQAQSRPAKDPYRMRRYWDGRLRKAEWELARAKGRMQKLRSKCIGDNDLVKHFHLGRVGGSGRQVVKLNRKRERELEAAIQLSQETEAARERVARLELRVARYLAYWRRWDEAITALEQREIREEPQATNDLQNRL